MADGESRLSTLDMRDDTAAKRLARGIGDDATLSDRVEPGLDALRLVSRWT